MTMATSKTYAAFRRTSGAAPRTITPCSETLPLDLGPTAVLVKIRAVSLNSRDGGMLTMDFPGIADGGIPASDCAAEVCEIGSAVKFFNIGDRVTVVFDTNNITGLEDSPPEPLGGGIPGVLREFAVFEEELLVKLPEHLTWEEGAILPCAALTAWSALNAPSSIGTARSVLLNGTGGVSMCALLICLAADIQPIITSSSDQKIESIKNISTKVQAINYKTTPDIPAEVHRITNGKGVDIVVNTIGPAYIPTSISMLRQKGGIVSLVGFLGGFQNDWDPNGLMAILIKRASIKGVGSGSKEDLLRMINFISEKKIQLSPIIDRVFPFNESKEAFDLLLSGGYMGKIVIKLGDA